MYPVLPEDVDGERKTPTAPPKADPGAQFRLNECNRIRDLVSKDIEKYTKLLKKNKIAFNVTNWSGAASTLTSSGTAIASITLLALSSGATFGVPLVAVSLVGGVVTLIAQTVNKKLVSKVKKYDKIITLGITHYKTISEIISNALVDETITDMEFRMLRNEYDKYINGKQEIKKKHFAYDVHNYNFAAEMEALKKQIITLKQKK